ncbi:hypothetical protein JZ751_009256 [Albula glossodonta]|uniref:Uncharacterized protein n=1 Tax=Albula glossodonta TaxID=121402 RepID=A0A8T2N1P5_9TELE|nr:hypothetical protein JZ751_009256 [Albula glossodonta]
MHNKYNIKVNHSGPTWQRCRHLEAISSSRTEGVEDDVCLDDMALSEEEPPPPPFRFCQALR